MTIDILCYDHEYDTRAVPDVPELVRYDLACDFDGNYVAHIVEVELGEYVRHSQAAAIIAAKDADIEYHQNENITLQICLDKTLKRAEAVEAKLAQYEAHINDLIEENNNLQNTIENMENKYT